MEILCGHIDPCKDNAEYKRIVFSIRIDKDLFDWIFNSVNGYRAWYFRSLYEGLRKNAQMIQMLEPKLLRFLNCQDYRIFAQDSLNSLSAKVWLAENGNEVCTNCMGCRGEWSPPLDDSAEILNGHWETSPKTNAKRGRKAPYLKKLRIYGAFLNECGDEWISKRKRHRASEIQKYGWS